MTAPLWLGLVLAIALYIALDNLHRYDELHHGYYGFAGVLLYTFPGHVHTVAAWVCLAVLLDDTVNHWAELMDVWAGRTPRSDWTPGHKVGVWLLLHPTWLKVAMVGAALAAAVPFLPAGWLG